MDLRKICLVFAFRHCVLTGSGAHLASCPGGTVSSFLGVKRLGHEADHSLPSNSEVKNALRYTSAPPLCLHVVWQGQTCTLNWLCPVSEYCSEVLVSV